MGSCEVVVILIQAISIRLVSQLSLLSDSVPVRMAKAV